VRSDSQIEAEERRRENPGSVEFRVATMTYARGKKISTNGTHGHDENSHPRPNQSTPSEASTGMRERNTVASGIHIAQEDNGDGAWFWKSRIGFVFY